MYAKCIYFNQDINHAKELCIKAHEKGDFDGLKEAFAILADDSWEDGADFLYENRNVSGISELFAIVFNDETRYLAMSKEDKRVAFVDSLMTYVEDTCSSYTILMSQPNHKYELYSQRTEFDPDNPYCTRTLLFYNHYYWTISNPDSYGYVFLH